MIIQSLFISLECSELHPCEGLNEHAHFRDFGMAFLTLFRVATGDNWNGIMKVGCSSLTDLCLVNISYCQNYHKRTNTTATMCIKDVIQVVHSKACIKGSIFIINIVVWFIPCRRSNKLLFFLFYFNPVALTSV